MIVFQDGQGLCFCPEELVMALTPAFPNRLRVVAADGTLGYCPAGREPFVRARVDPAGFDHGEATLAVVADFAVPTFWGLEVTSAGLLWHGEGGTVPCELSLEQASEGLCQFSPGWYFHPQRLRHLTREELVLDQGRRFGVSDTWRPRIWKFLGISSLQLMPEALTRNFLREYPFEIAWAPAEVLRQHFSSAAALIANLIWQALLYHRCGLTKGYGVSHRGFWYNPLDATLERAGFVEYRLSKEAVERCYHRLLAQMVDEDRLFTYQELGFSDVYATDREIGSRPDVLLMIEKKDLAAQGIQVARQHGLSWMITGGVSRLVAAEFYSAALRQVYAGDVRLLVYGDFDPGGRLAGRSLVEHLRRFGVNSTHGPEFLIVPSVFHQQELELFSRPLTAEDGQVEDFLAETGGIDGKPRGIHADWLRPVERLAELVAAALDLHRKD